MVGDGCTGVGYLHGGAIGNGLKEAEEGYFMRGETWCSRRGGADAGDVNGATGEGRED